MEGTGPGKTSRREFLKKSMNGLAGFATAQYFTLTPGLGQAAGDEKIVSSSTRMEPNPVVKVLRWSAFVQDDEDLWMTNTRRWEKLTGGRVETDFLSWQDVRPKAAMEATIGAGHDIVFGWYDDPHLYPEKLLNLTDIAEYLGKKYGGWYPNCGTYGRVTGTNRWIALPLGLLGHCLNYRKSHVQAAGFEKMPNDIAGLLKCCKALKAKRYPTGFALGHAVGDANAWTHWWLWSFGGKAVEADGKTIAVNTPKTIQSLETARELYDTMIPGVENWLDPDNNKAFLSGTISLTTNGSSIVYDAKRNSPKIDSDLAVVNLPVGPVGNPAELSVISSGFIFKHTPVPKAARHYLMFMFEAEQYGPWIGGSFGYITQALKYYYDLSSWKQDPRITPYRECASRVLPNSHAGPLGKTSAAAMSEYIIVDMFAEACTGRRTTRQAALVAEKKLARLYKPGRTVYPG